MLRKLLAAGGTAIWRAAVLAVMGWCACGGDGCWYVHTVQYGTVLVVSVPGMKDGGG